MEKQIGLSFKDISLNAKGYEIEELIELIKVITTSDIEGVNTSEVKKLKVKTKKEADIEEIDVRELRKNIRFPKTTSNFKCPSCGQGILIKNMEKNMLIVRDITKEKATLYNVDVVELPKLYEDEEMLRDTLIAVYNDLLTLKNEEVLLIDSDDSICSCPVCSKEHSVQKWIEAYENPMKYFALMNICEICAEEGEIVLTQLGDNLLCENKCIERIKV